jgi:hypothetical protein
MDGSGQRHRPGARRRRHPGQLKRRSLIAITVSLVHGLEGVVDVVDRLAFEVDDSPIMVPSTC